MFQTEEDWEITDGNPFRRALMGQPSLRKYHLLELTSNVPIYRLDVVYMEEEKDEQVLRRFIFDDLWKVLSFIDRLPIMFHRLVQETPFLKMKKAEFREICCVSLASDERGERILVLDSDRGRFRVGQADETAGSLSDVQQIWPVQTIPTRRL
jgi:hypothetical protein